MSRDRAAYMREYRKRRKMGQSIRDIIATEQPPALERDEARRMASDYATLANDQRKRIAELEEEVRHLKAELAKRPATRELIERSIATAPRRTHTGHRDGNPGAASDRFNTRPFTPVPKRK